MRFTYTSVMRTLGLLLIGFVGLLIVHDAVGLGGATTAISKTIAATAIGIVVTPAITLAMLSFSTTHLGDELRGLGRGSAFMLMLIGLALVKWSLRSASTFALAGGIVAVAFGGWVIARSSAVTPLSTEPKKRVSFNRLLFIFVSIPVLVGFVPVAFTLPPLKAKAFRTAMKSDLRNMVDAQQAFHDANGRFASLSELQAWGFKKSTGVTVAVAADSSAWRALAWHQALAEECTIWMKRRPPDERFAETEGEPVCHAL